jgi:hypothetical protein
MSSFYPLKTLIMPLSTHPFTHPHPQPKEESVNDEMVKRRHRDGRTGSDAEPERKKTLTLTTEIMAGVAKDEPRP